MVDEEENDVPNIPSILSVALPALETEQIKNLSDELGISVSHLGRALIRFGLQSVKAVDEGVYEELMLRLIKLGK